MWYVCRGGCEATSEPAEASARERLRLSFPPRELRPDSVPLTPSTRCQCVVRGDVVVSKFEGFWGARPTLAPCCGQDVLR